MNDTDGERRRWTRKVIWATAREAMAFRDGRTRKEVWV